MRLASRRPRLLLLLIAAALAVVGLFLAWRCQGKEPASRHARVVAAMRMVPDSGNDRVALLVPLQPSSTDAAVQEVTEWARERGWSTKVMNDERIRISDATRPDWVRVGMTKVRSDGNLGLMWIGPAGGYLSQPVRSVEANEFLRKQSVREVQDREDLILVWDLVIYVRDNG